MAITTAAQKVMAARTDLILDQPFFGVLALKLKLVEDPTCPTAWTDGTSMGFNPTFVNSLTREKLLGVIAHEVMHCSNGHPWRRDNRDPQQFNVACDYAINYVLEECRFKLPEFRLREAQYDGKSAEWIYARLPRPKKSKQQQQQGGTGKGTGKGQGDAQQAPPQGAGTPGQGDMPSAGGCDVRDAPSMHSDKGTSEADWQQAVQQAAIAAKAAGKLPATLERFAKVAAAPRVDWKSVLRRFVQSAARSDYAWTRPNARYLAGGFYLPSLKSESMGPIAIVVDTSGSINDVLLSLFGAEMNAIHSEMRPVCTYVLYADAAVHRIDRFETDDLVELHPVGGGGTAFAPALDAAERLDDEPVCLVYLTDRYGSDRKTPPPFPVLWASIGAQTAPYGEVVSLEHV